ncbi:MAG: Rieske 2Fe-2S domain-containing protein [Rhodocyclales bacterium]|nr:Rieske 2Fe-2S domain-containing protein [Rhodocyclales bacterium]
MVETERMICASAELADGGKGIRFEIPAETGTQSAFVVRHDGQVYGYLNRCAHIGVELDWQLGEFFDDSGLYLVCSTHGATYLPDSGKCIAGPCRGARLTQLEVFEQNGGVYLK